ncbi:MAG: hypothetical protein QG670_1709, partial [Thermoproteota archaeon]|nr:hypothetical protein [Thermoproteota archaeon]
MNRSRIETLCAILKVSSKEVRKTKIRYKANLNHHQLEKYLDFLIKKKLLVEDLGQANIYSKTTSKGIEFIKSCERIQSMLGLDENDDKR